MGGPELPVSSVSLVNVLTPGAVPAVVVPVVMITVIVLALVPVPMLVAVVVVAQEGEVVVLVSSLVVS